MSEMVERVAKAIAADESRTWSEMDGVEVAMYFSFARAAIAAMREPTEAMANAPDVYRAGAVGGHFDVCTPTDYAKIWQAMIDAAIETPPTDKHA